MKLNIIIKIYTFLFFVFAPIKAYLLIVMLIVVQLQMEYL